MTRIEWCAVCRRPSELVDVLRVTELATGRTRYVCRPMRNGGECFRVGVRPAAIDEIEAADPDRFLGNVRPTEYPDERDAYRAGRLAAAGL